MPYENLFLDPKTDKIGKLISDFEKYPRWTLEKRAAKDKFINALKNANYENFIGHRRDYHLSGIGSSYLYKVPTNKRGNLKIYRGELIRIVCVDQLRFDVMFMVKIVKFDIKKLTSFKDHLNQILITNGVKNG